METRKVKKGEVFRYTGTLYPFREQTVTVLEVETCDRGPIVYWSCYDKTCRTTWAREYSLQDFELVSFTPTTFEVGKKYKLRSGTHIYLVKYVEGQDAFATSITENVNAILKDFNRFEEYTPPPPEEWRAVYWVNNSKPEISSCIMTSKEAIEREYGKVEGFMYAIRTDKGAMKNAC